MATNAGGRPIRTGWFTSSRSNNGNQCVEVKFGADAVWIRDSKYRCGAAGEHAAQPVLSVTASEWDDLVARLRSGGPAPELITENAGGGVELRRDGTVLTFTRAEWDAFLGGVADGEFDRVPQPG
ncbi:DUF397 domain-containing protein [Nocardia higoensis]|uniref:DUF397 domain-containing protein n=1 Tax=Nocardia higoensis TaxID=228599 RepID=A0ABS0DE46_9NOCA|nr:DUF397 domain-containing protein [Nocardia higoensis]MBF6356740.1 DUF397 domain-containing protein [Nocardia higoensis]